MSLLVTSPIHQLYFDIISFIWSASSYVENAIWVMAGETEKKEGQHQKILVNETDNNVQIQNDH